MTKPNLGNPNARGVEGNMGNTVPKHLSGISADQAERVTNQYNAESTYHPDINNESFTHLRELSDHVNRLAESSTSVFAELAKHSVDAAGNAHINHDNASALEHVRAVHDTLQNMKHDSTILPEIHPFLDRAAGHAAAYLQKFTPARVVPSSKGEASVSIDPDYRARAYVDTSRDKDNKLGGQFRGFTSPDALFQKRTYPAEQAKKAKNYVKPKKGTN